MAEPSSRKYRRVLLQIDAATLCQDTVGAAVEIAARLGGELHGLFIEDTDLVAVGELEFIHEFRLSSPTAHPLDLLTLESQLRAMARSVRRQLERAGNRQKVTIGFRSVRGDTWRTEEETSNDADLVIIESTGRLHSRTYRGHRTNRRSAVANLCPTLLLKGGKRLTSFVTVICDSVEAAKLGVRTVTTLLGVKPENITLLPYALNDQECQELREIIEQFAEETMKTAEGRTQIKIGPNVAEDGARVMRFLSPDDCVVVLKTGGIFLENPAHLESLIVSRHPLLFVQ
ncbi:universal stress protein [Sneathiella litorea]|uniref:UspA domain-containing protein n=1 Tax=Sneathiella litorea TaxID=2606216 RepID=A0A6L8W4W8_9PROT|nr:universal stress protein [Sneathiella litorea]MZR30098.1 hypothetical protein [Sneathiella litorea]